MRCSIKGCDQESKAKNLCNKHYQRVRSFGDPYKDRKKKPKCSVDDCTNLNWCESFCPKHYRRYKRHGDPFFINEKCNRDGKSLERKYKKVKEWKKNNWPEYFAYLKARKSRMKKATPKWANLNEIKKFYLECPKGYHVDHIIPLNGEIVSGLHVLGNLQYLLAKLNLEKGNSFK